MSVDLKPEDQRVVDAILEDAMKEDRQLEQEQQVTEVQPKEEPTQEQQPQAAKETQQTTDQPAKQEEKRGDVRAALRASRHAERLAKAEIERLRQENEALRKGEIKPKEEISDEELEELERDFPAQAMALKKARAAEARIAALEEKLAKSGQAEFQPITFSDEVQDAIDQVPVLLELQHDPNGQDKFQRAIEIDKELSAQPEWQNRPLQDRFAEVAKRVSAPTQQRRDPAQVIADAPTNQPERISQMHGGASPNKLTPDYSKMSNEDILNSLPVMN